MDVDLEVEVKISREELQVLLLHEFRLSHKATEATSVVRWGRMYSLFVQRNMGSIDSSTATSNSTIYLIPGDQYK